MGYSPLDLKRVGHDLVTKQQQKLNNMCLTLENSADFVDLLGMSQEEERVEIITLKVYLLLGPHSMDTQINITFFSSCKLHSQRHWTWANEETACPLESKGSQGTCLR